MQNAEIEKIVEEKNENDDSIKASENISNKEDKRHKENKIEKDVKNITEKKS